MTKLSIIILNFNTKDLTISCIKSIQKNYKKELEKKEIEIIAVDNGSTDGSAEAISNFQFPLAFDGTNFKLIRNKENLGFSKGNNIGVKESSGKYLLFLNSDTKVLDKEFLQMVDFLEKNRKIGILGGKLKNPDGTSQESTGKFFDLINVFLMLFGGEKLLRFSPNKEELVDWVSGASLMVRSELFRRLEGFDDNFFMYMEDMDLCLRARNLGYSTYFYPKIDIVHNEHGSSNRSFAIINIYKGLPYFYKKHKTYLEYNIVKILLKIKAMIAIVIGLLTRDKYLINTYKTAIKF